MKKTFTLLLLMCSLSLFSQTIYYVTPTGNDINNGLSWASAFKTLQRALSTATSGQIWVAAGTYYPDVIGSTNSNDRNASFYLKNNVALYGGFAGSETTLGQRNWNTHVTTLSGDIDQVAGNDSNSLHVVRSVSVDNTACLDGFTITGGNASFTDGGGMHNAASSATITNCTFAGNYTSGDGGGVYNGRSPVTITNCTFTSNSSDYGGGIFNQSCVPAIRNCSFVGNSASWSGGGIDNDYSDVPIINCSFARNSASNYGGAISNYYSDATIINCSFGGNIAYGGGGVLSNTECSATLTNCILWGNGSLFHDGLRGSQTVTYSIVQGGYGGTGNLNADPMFISIAGGDLRLRGCSWAINAATPTGAPATDLEGMPRPSLGGYDMGAYEFQSGGAGNILYVKQNATGTGDGGSWTNAFTNLQNALAKARACYSPVQIWVARGTYYPDEGTGLADNDRTLSFTLQNSISLYGGFAGTETTISQRNLKADTTILSGHIDTAADIAGNSLHVVKVLYADNKVVLDGFTITGGNANGTTTGYPENSDVGGGIFLNNSFLTITNCIIHSNHAAVYGGGIMSKNSSSPVITNCIFYNNSASISGGALSDYQYSSNIIRNCSFYGNTAPTGGVIHNFNSSPAITNCIFWGNSLALFNNISSTTYITYSIVQGGFIGTGNLNVDPLFVQAAAGNLHLLGCSPAINSGTATEAPTTDLEGNSRPIWGAYDMGAYEYPVRGTGSIIYVKASATGANNGTSWTNAFTKLQDALARASTCTATQIWVAAGIYYPDEGTGLTNNDRTLSFSITPGIALYGGFMGWETALSQRNWMSNETILSGEIDRISGISGNAYHVVSTSYADSTAILDGFSITDGAANGSTSPLNKGGAMYNMSTSPTVVNCSFYNNKGNFGAAIYNESASPHISNSRIFLNNALNGGGMFNRASSPVLINCSFYSNEASQYGGGIYNEAGSAPTIMNCTLSQNSAPYGGAMRNVTASAPTITNSILWNNGSQISNSSSIPVVTYSIVQGGYSGTGNLNTDPMLLYDQHLRGCSPAINAGTSNGAPTSDGEGKARPVLGGYDMGAYEFQPDGAGTVLYVKANATGNGNGTSWTNAFTKLQDALAKAGTCYSSTQIWIAAGTYYPDEGAGQTNNRQWTSFTLKNHTAIYGGFAGTEADLSQRNWRSHVTTLSGNIDQVAGNTGNTWTIIDAWYVDSTAILDGFTITGAYPPSDGQVTWGGGMFAGSSSAKIANCIFHDNTSYEGAGIYNQSSNITITNCTFYNNTAWTSGAAIRNRFSAPVITNCTFYGNTAGGQGGGGIFTSDSPPPTVTNSILWGNTPNQVSGGNNITYSLVQGGYSGTGNLNVDPLFANTSTYDLRLQACSPAIDAGYNDAATSPYDLGSNNRIVDNHVDMGAYEFQGTVIYVKANATGGNNGTSWANAFTKLQDALAAVNSCSKLTMIWVAAGTYYPDEGVGLVNNDRTLTFRLKNRVSVLGGFNGGETTLDQRTRYSVNNNKTILSGDIDKTAGTTGNAYHVVTGVNVDSTAVLDGFTITGGNANSNTIPNNRGGGIYNSSAYPVISNCTVSSNNAIESGGGIYNQGGSPTIVKCKFNRDTAISGGAIYNDNVTRSTILYSTFWANKAYNGAAIYNIYSSPGIINCSFSQNLAYTVGGGMYNVNSAPNITNCILWGNSSQINNANSTPVVTYSIVQGGYSGTGNLAADPLFNYPDTGNLTIRSGSPAINAGNNAAVPPGTTTDLDNNWLQGTVDIGAYETISTQGEIDDESPIFIICPPDYILTSSSGSCGAVGDFTGNHAAYAFGGVGPVTITYNPVSGTVLPLGQNAVNVTATDSAGHSKTCSFIVTVTDFIPPVLTCAGSGGQLLKIAMDADKCTYTVKGSELDVNATDNCSAPLIYHYSLSGATVSAGPVMSNTLKGVVFNPGETTIDWVVLDAAGNEAGCTATVTVADATPPVISVITATPNILYPPNHKMQDIALNYMATDNCGSLSTTLTVVSNEPVSSSGIGDTAPDWEITDDHHLKLRAERLGSGSDRVYTLTVTARDATANTTTGTVTVSVPHDNRVPLTSAQKPTQALRVQALPNPSAGGFTLIIQSPSAQLLTLKIMDATARVLEQHTGVSANTTLYIGEKYLPGVYYVQVVQGDEMQSVKLIKQ